MDFAESLRKRTKKMALDIISLYRAFPHTEEARILGKQLLRAGTSVAANYRSACRARSDAEFYSKLCIVVEEADEVVFWLELIEEAAILRNEQSKQIFREANEILSIMATSRKTVKEKLSTTH
jgi:four helix bundle protein